MQNFYFHFFNLMFYFKNVNIKFIRPVILFGAILLIGLDSIDLIAQVNNDYSVVSPEAASLGKWNDTKVSYATGIPDINIPIYNITYGPLDIPLQLNYFAGGYRVTDVSNWIGLGWTLSADQMITRVIKGIPDESNTGYFNTGHELSYCANQDELDLSFPLHPCLLLQVANGDKDGEPDLFSYSFNGNSGKFYIGIDTATSQLEVRKIDETDLKITFEYDPMLMQGQRLKSFTIITPDGVKYKFGTVGNSEAIDYSQVGQIGEYNENWRLIQVSSYDENYQINFEYDVNNYEFLVTSNTSYMMYEHMGMHEIVNSTSPTFSKIVFGHRLSKISYGNTEIELIANNIREDVDNNNKMLDEIIITNGQFCKKFSLTHDYYDAGGTPAIINKRLRLKEVQEKICGANPSQYEIVNPYIFEYNGNYLPPLTSRDRDHWGFYNAANNVTGNLNIPLSSHVFPSGFMITVGGSNRDPNANAMATGILDKIILPTKGEISYEFEANQYLDVTLNQNKTCGGVRIKSITKHDAVNISNNVVTNYTYSNPQGKSSGILFKSNGNSSTLPVYARSFSLSMGNNPCGFQCPYLGTQPGSCGTANIFYCEDESFRPMTSSNGSVVFYEYVTESFSNLATNTYIYHVPDMPPIGPIFTYPQPPDQISLRAGMLKEQYTTDGGFEGIVYENKNFNSVHYTRSPEYFLKVKPYVLIGENCNSVDFEYTIYPIFSGHAKLTKTITKNFNVEQVQDYTYDSQNRHLNPITIETKNSDNKIHKTTLDYVFDYPDSNIKNYLLQNNVIKTPFKESKLVNNIQIDGNEFEFGYYNLSTGIYTGAPLSSIPRIYKLYRFKKTWDQFGNLTGPGKYLLKTNIGFDSNGNIASYNFDGWQNTSFQWNNFHSLLNETYLTHFKNYQYYPSSSMVATITDIDQQVISYNYDNLMRLKTVSERNTNLVSDYKYHFSLPTDMKNWIKKVQEYTVTPNSLLDSLVTISYFDGLGRDIQRIQKYGAPDGLSDVITKTEYDNIGYISKEYEPVSVGSNNGNYYSGAFTGGYTQSIFQANPLEILSGITPPDWLSTNYNYSTNFNSLTNPEGLVYPELSLRIYTSTDPDGNSHDVYKDKLGRVILSRNRLGTSNTDTWTIYDDKNRPVTIYPPNTSSSTPNLIFQFRYDEDDNLIYKKVPDSGAEEYAFNIRNLEVAKRNSILLAQNRWLITHYDDFGRSLKRGYFNGAIPTPSEMPTIHILLEEYFYDGFNGSTTNTAPIYKGKLRKKRIKVLEDLSNNSNWVETQFAYDTYGRVSQETITNHLNETEIVSYTYDFADNVTKTIHILSSTTNQGINHTETRTYDHQGRKIYDKILLSNDTEKTTSECIYDHKSQIIERNLGRHATSGTHQYLQSLDYSYNAQRWLTGINTLYDDLIPTPLDPCVSGGSNFIENHPSVITNTDSEDLFAFGIDYNSTLSGSGVPSNLNGNITSLKWWHRNSGQYNQTYSYKYDYLNRVTEAKHGEIVQGLHTLKNQYNESFEYDDRGNITKLVRKGMVNRPDLNELCYQPTTIDSLSYIYLNGSNKLIQVIDRSPCLDTITLPAIIDRDINYAAGQLIRIEITDVLCNVNMNLTAGTEIRVIDTLHLPKTCGTPALVIAYQGPCPLNKYTEGFNQQSINGQYLYDLGGNMTYDPNKKLTFYYNFNNLPYRIVGAENDELQMLYDARGSLLQRKYFKNNVEISRYDYLRGKERINSELKHIYFADGRVIKTGTTYSYEYWIKDHLGNVRVTFADDNNNGLINGAEIRSRNDYYSFGMEWNNYLQQGEFKNPINRFQYNGKELVEEMELNHQLFGARNYDPIIGRWWNVDPLSKKMPSWSSYNFSFDNPLIFIDPNGLSPFSIYGDPITDIKRTLSSTSATVQRNFDDAVNYTRKEVAPFVGAVAEAVGFAADVVQFIALGATALSGGTSAPVTLPIAAFAEVVGVSALGVQASAEFVEKGNLNDTKSEILVKAVAGSIGYQATKSINTIKNVSDETIYATNAIAQGVINTAEKATNYKISNSKIKKTESSSVNTYNNSVSIINFSVTDKNQRN